MKSAQPKKMLVSRQATKISRTYSPDHNNQVEQEDSQDSPDRITNVIDFRSGRPLLNTPNILNLQKTVGNKAVQRLIEMKSQPNSIQKGNSANNQIQRRVFMTTNDFDNQVDNTDPTNAREIRGIRATLTAYNNVATSTRKYATRLRILNSLDKKLYGWLNNRPSKDLANVSNSDLIHDLLKKSNTEHERIIDAIKDQADMLPIDTKGMSSVEINQVKDLWQSIIAGSGNIKVLGNKKFEKRTFSQLAKILQTPTGRQLLTYLDDTQKTGANRDDRIIILEKLTEEYAHIEEGRTSESSYAMSLNSFKPDNTPETEKNSHMMGFGSNLNGAPDENQYQAMNNAKDLNTAILSGAKGITANGQKMTFGEGSGAIVKITDNDVKTEKMAGENKNEVIDPTFVTLAHELGHAFKMRAGALADNGSLSTPFEQTLETNTDEQMLWSKKPEEFLNIQGVENPVREESGMQRRKYHKPLGSVIAYKRFAKLRDILWGVSNKDKLAIEIPAWQQLNQLLNTSKNSLGDNNIYNPLKVQIQNINAVVDDNAIKQHKAQILNNSVNTIKDTAGDEDFNKYVTRSREYRGLMIYVRNNWDTLVAPGTDLQPTKDKVRGVRTNLDTIIAREKKSYRKEKRQNNWKNFKGAFGF